MTCKTDCEYERAAIAQQLERYEETVEQWDCDKAIIFDSLVDEAKKVYREKSKFIGGTIIEPYENLANAIVLQAVKDYRLYDDEQELTRIERFFRSDWFSILTNVDPETLITKLRKEKVCYEY